MLNKIEMSKVNNKTIKLGSRSLSYSMYDFIYAVKQHDAIWNREHENFHGRELRDRAWFDVARQLYRDFDAASVTEKQKIAATFAKRWKNTRDSFFRTLRRQEYDKKSHSYIYEKEMGFILNFKRKSSLKKVIKKQRKPKRQTIKGSRKTADDNDDNDDFEEGNNDDTATLTSKSIKTEKNQSKERLRASQKKAVTKKKILAAKKMRYNADFDNELVSLLDEEDSIGGSESKQQKQQPQPQHIDSNDSNEFIETYSFRPTPTLTNELNNDNKNYSVNQSPAQEAQQQNYETAFVTFAKDFTQNTLRASTPPAAVAATKTKPTAMATSKSAATAETSSGDGGTAAAAAAASSSEFAQSPSFFHSHASDMDADQAFLYSITPAIRSMSLEKKLDFQIDVLRLLKNYTSKS